MEILIAAALIPAVIVMWYIWKKDKVEKEPTKMILRVAIAGAVSTISAIILELIGDSILLNVFEMDKTSVSYGLAEFFLVVGVAEEIGKLVALRIATWRSNQFNYTYDAVVYAVASSLGFAALENVLYVCFGGLGTAFVRAFTAIPGHAMFGVFMGYYYGMARQAWGRGKVGSQMKNMLLAFIVPVILHGIYDFCIFASQPDPDGPGLEFFMLVWLAFLVLIFILAMVHINKLSAMDTPILGTGLDFPEERPEGPKAPAGSSPADIYGQPYPQPIRAPQAQAPSYAQPQPAPQYGQAPSYAQPQPSAPRYGQAPSYAQPQASAPRYGQAPSYAQPQASAPRYGQAPSYAQPQASAPRYGQAPSYAQPQPSVPQYGQAPTAPAPDVQAPPPPPPPPRPRKIYHPEGMAIPDEMMGLVSEIDEEPSIRYDPFGIAPAQIKPAMPGLEEPAAPAEKAAVRDLGGRPDPAMDEENLFGSLADNSPPKRTAPDPFAERRLPPLDPL